MVHCTRVATISLKARMLRLAIILSFAAAIVLNFDTSRLAFGDEADNLDGQTAAETINPFAAFGDSADAANLETAALFADFQLPADSTQFSPSFASSLLMLCSGHTAELTAQLFEMAGVQVVLQQRYDKSDEDLSHTCAYTIGMKPIEYGPYTRTVVLVAIRGTNAAEWYANFDIAPSHSNDTAFAENFLFAAEDVLVSLQGVLASVENPIIIVCGHSRGAACANILGMLFDEILPLQDIYVYTFATPATIHAAELKSRYPNIFNILNPCDAVIRLPLAAWGYERAGTDIVLPGDDEKSAALDKTIEVLYSLAPDIESYYTLRHSLTGPGQSDEGMSTFEAMLIIARTLAQSSNLAFDAADPQSATASFSTANADENADGSFDFIDESSDFAVLTDALTPSADEGKPNAQSLLEEHLPTRYLSLILQWQAEQAALIAAENPAPIESEPQS